MKKRKDTTSLSARLKLSLVFLVYKMLNGALDFIANSLFFYPQNPKKILIFRVGALGDSLCAMPVIVNIRNHFPSARIDLLINGGKQNAVTLETLLDSIYYDEIINYATIDKKEVFKKIKARSYDLVIQLPQVRAPYFSLFRDMFVFRFAGIKSGIGWEYKNLRLFKKTQDEYLIYKNEVDRLNNILHNHGIKIATKNNYPLIQSQLDEDIVEALLLSKGVDRLKKNIALIPGAGFKRNIWHIENFKQVAKFLSGDYNVFLIGGEKEKEMAVGFAKMENVFSFIGELTPLQSAYLLKKCQFVVSNDTGPMHLAYAVGTPVIAIFSARNHPGKWFPPDDGKNRVLRTAGMPCAICSERACDDNICMQKITTSQMIDAINKILSQLKK